MTSLFAQPPELMGVESLSDQEIEGILKSPTDTTQLDSGLLSNELFKRPRPSEEELGGR